MKLNKILKKIWCLIILCVLIYFGFQLYHEYFFFRGQSEEETMQLLNDNKKLIIQISQKFNVDPRITSGIIYTEHRLNMNILDRYENLYAYIGVNPSIGLCQIRILTAYWIIEQATNSTSEYCLPNKYNLLIPTIATQDEMINQLQNDSVNITLAVIHISQIINRWKKSGVDLTERPDIIGTLYSYGLQDRKTGMEILPHHDPKSNTFGKIVLEFYRSNWVSPKY